MSTVKFMGRNCSSGVCEAEGMSSMSSAVFITFNENVKCMIWGEKMGKKKQLSSERNVLRLETFREQSFEMKVSC